MSNDDVAIVTGAARGIGSAYARGLAEDGKSVVLADILYDRAHAKAEELTSEGHQAIAYECDVTSAESWAGLVEHTVTRFGKVDILVNNAALMGEVEGDMLKIAIEDWERVFRINLIGPLLGIRAVVPSMTEHGWGKIVNQSSGGAFKDRGGAYNASKLALLNMTMGFARKLAPMGIRVNAIAPGLTKTEQSEKIVSEEFVRYIDENAPLSSGTPEDLVGALLFLTSRSSDWVTGQCLNVDGGWVMRL
jgi:NAD(P)-dependent dehydrogenase (short-subunit alcohol dehydrogenase family)